MTKYEIQYLENKAWKKAFGFERLTISDWEASCVAEDILVALRESDEAKDKDLLKTLDRFSLRLIKWHENGYNIIQSWD